MEIYLVYYVQSMEHAPRDSVRHQDLRGALGTVEGLYLSSLL